MQSSSSSSRSRYEREPDAPLVRPHVRGRLKPARRRGNRQYERSLTLRSSVLMFEDGSSRHAFAATGNTSASLTLRSSVLMFEDGLSRHAVAATGNTSASLTLGSSVLMFEDGLSWHAVAATGSMSEA